MIKKIKGQYCTIHCTEPDKGKVIKCFPTKEAAEKQHQAIQASKNVKKVEIDVNNL